MSTQISYNKSWLPTHFFNTYNGLSFNWYVQKCTYIYNKNQFVLSKLIRCTCSNTRFVEVIHSYTHSNMPLIRFIFSFKRQRYCVSLRYPFNCTWFPHSTLTLVCWPWPILLIFQQYSVTQVKYEHFTLSGPIALQFSEVSSCFIVWFSSCSI